MYEEVHKCRIRIAPLLASGVIFQNMGHWHLLDIISSHYLHQEGQINKVEWNTHSLGRKVGNSAK